MKSPLSKVPLFAILTSLGLVALASLAPVAEASTTAPPSASAPTSAATASLIPTVNATSTTSASTRPTPTTPAGGTGQGTVTGLITEANTGKPIVISEVVLASSSDDTAAVTLSSAGHYTLTAPVGTYQVVVEPGMGYKGGTWPYLGRRPNGPTPGTKSPTVTLTEDTTVTVDMTLTRAGHVSGVVVNAMGRPERNQHLFVRVQQVAFGEILHPGGAGADGTFSFYVGGAVVPTRARIFVYTAVSDSTGEMHLGWMSREFTIGPELVVTHVRAVPVGVATSPSSSVEATKAGLPQTGSNNQALPVTLAGFLLVATGGALLVLLRRTPTGHH